MNKKVIFSSVFIIVGTITGAGFISGREIVQFFLNGDLPLNIIEFGVLYFWEIFYLLSDRFYYNSAFYRFSFFPILIADLFMTGGLLSAADDIIFKNFYYIKFPFSSIIIIAFSFYIQRKHSENLGKICRILTPITVVFTIVLVLTSKSLSFYKTSGRVNFAGVFSYAGLNVFVAAPLLKNLQVKFNSKKEVFFTALISTLILIILIILISCFVCANKKAISDSLPLYIVLSRSGFSKCVFTIVMLCGITTAVLSEHYSVEKIIENLLEKKGKQTKICLFAVPIVVIFISKLGFYNIVAYAYPIIGFIGGVMILISAIFRLVFRVRRHRDTLKPQAHTK